MVAHTIVLSIRDTGGPPNGVFLVQVLVDGKVVGADRGLSVDDSRFVRELSSRYSALFEGPFVARVTSDTLIAIGADLFERWLAPAWSEVVKLVPSGATRRLVIASAAPAALNLPWELLRPPSDDFAGFDPNTAIRRMPWAWGDRNWLPAPAQPRDHRPGPMRVLFVACAPADQAELNFEREEVAIFEAMRGVPGDTAFHTGDLGTFEELQDLVAQVRPHIVHLSGHGVLGRRCAAPACGRIYPAEGDSCLDTRCAASLAGVPVLGYFAFEDAEGHEDMRSSVELWRDCLANMGVQAVFVSGCQTGKTPDTAALGGIAQGLAGAGVPLALGWAASVADDLATGFAARLYRAIAAGTPIDLAVTRGRQGIRQESGERGDPAWTLPVLYSGGAQELVFDPDPRRREYPPRPAVRQESLAGINQGHTEHFVGRRREQQRLLPALRQGSRRVVMLTGIGGAGKSTLATRLARKLEADGYRPVALSGEPETTGGPARPLTADRLLTTCGDAIRAAARQHRSEGDGPRADGLEQLANGLELADAPIERRLRDIIAAFNESRFVLVLDNFEVNLTEATRAISDTRIAEFYRHLLNDLRLSRAIITTRYLPSDLTPLPPYAVEESLPDFPRAAFVKFLLRDEIIAARYRAGELPPELLGDLHTELGGVPRFLDQIQQVLHDIDADELRRSLTRLARPAGATPDTLQAARDRYCQEVFTARLYQQLDEAARRALCRGAVYGVPVTLEALAAVTGEPADRLSSHTRGWRNYALAYPESGPDTTQLWAVYPLLRGWLLDQLDAEDRRTAHQAAGNYLSGLEKQDREDELGLTWVECLREARTRFILAGDCDGARAATDRLSGYLVRQGFYDESRRLNLELLIGQRHPSPMGWIARAYYQRGDYARARTWYQRQLRAAGQMMPQEAAAAVHGLATLALEQGDYPTARTEFERSLAIRQALGDRAGEAASFFQMGALAVRMGREEQGLRLVALCYLIDREIGHGDTETDFENLAKLASRLNYDQAQFVSV